MTAIKGGSNTLNINFTYHSSLTLTQYFFCLYSTQKCVKCQAAKGFRHMQITQKNHFIDQNNSANLHDIDQFLELLPTAIYCSHDIKNGCKLKPKNIAINAPYIRLNCRNLTRFLSFDLDHDNPLIWFDSQLPPPQYVVKNQDNNKCHYIYVLTDPISTSKKSSDKAIDYMRAISSSYTQALNADYNYNAALTKNPFHKNYRIIRPTLKPSYTLHELANPVYDCILDNLKLKIEKKYTVKSKNSEKYASRNCDIFDDVRVLAYKIAHKHTYSELYRIVLDMCIEHNAQHDIPLNYNEIKCIAKSIAEYCDKNRQKFKSLFQSKQKARGKKSGANRQAKSDERRQYAQFLYHQERLTVKQISDKIGCSEKTVRSYLKQN